MDGRLGDKYHIWLTGWGQDLKVSIQLSLHAYSSELGRQACLTMPFWSQYATRPQKSRQKMCRSWLGGSIAPTNWHQWLTYIKSHSKINMSHVCPGIYVPELKLAKVHIACSKKNQILPASQPTTYSVFYSLICVTMMLHLTHVDLVSKDIIMDSKNRYNSVEVGCS